MSLHRLLSTFFNNFYIQSNTKTIHIYICYNNQSQSITKMSIRTLLYATVVLPASLALLAHQVSSQVDQTRLANDENQLQNVDFLRDRIYTGKYRSHDDNVIGYEFQKIFDYIYSQSGVIEVFFIYNPEWSKDTVTSSFNGFVFEIFDPIYHDRAFVVGSFQLENRTTDYEWNSSSQKIEYIKYWKGMDGDKETMDNVTFTLQINNGESKDYSKVSINFSLEGSSLHITSDMSYKDDKIDVIGYCLYITFMACLQILAMWRLLKKIDEANPAIAQKISLTTVSICNIMDFYLTIIHIQYIIASRSSFYLMYIMPALAYIVLFIVFGMKLLFIVWRNHTMREVLNAQDLRKNLTLFYIKFYVGLFVYLGALYFFIFDEWFIIIQSLIFIPQIVRNYRIGNNPGFELLYIFGYLGLRFFKLFYERICPNNNFLLMPMVDVVIVIFVLYCIQIGILLLQSKLGARFFVPKIFQPDYFDYQFKIKYSDENHQLQCAICLENFFSPQTNEDINSSQLSEPVIEERSVLRTPCKHFFHKECLISWTDVKLECPSCRKTLPPIP